jgi:hypothetical protein
VLSVNRVRLNQRGVMPVTLYQSALRRALHFAAAHPETGAGLQTMRPPFWPAGTAWRTKPAAGAATHWKPRAVPAGGNRPNAASASTAPWR